jgi:hypothetical protein
VAPMASPKMPGLSGNISGKRESGLYACLPSVLALIAVCACLAASSPAFAKENYMTDPRVALIRGLDREIAVAKIPLPAGKKGVVINRKGLVEQQSAADQLRSNGMSVQPGMPVEITKIDFHDDKIVFEINGGGKRGKKWYQHIEIGVGGPGAMEPLVPDQPKQARTLGSYITVTLPQKGTVPTTEQAKQMLSSILDFHRQAPTALYSPSLPPKFKEAIKIHVVMPGMDKDAVLSAKGPPDRKVRDVAADGSEEEDWIYGLPPHVLYVVFDGDTVKQVTQY